MHSRVFAIVRKETREIIRDPIYLGLAIVVPLIIMVLLGLGFVLDVKNLPCRVLRPGPQSAQSGLHLFLHEFRIFPPGCVGYES